MQDFIHKHRQVVTGSLSGFDRLVLRGTLRQLSYVKGMLSSMAFAPSVVQT